MVSKAYDEIDLGEWQGGSVTVEQLTFDDTVYDLTLPKEIRNGDYLILVGTLVDGERVELTLWIDPRPEELARLIPE